MLRLTSLPLIMSCTFQVPTPTAEHQYNPSSSLATSLNTRSLLLLSQIRRSKLINDVKNVERPSQLYIRGMPSTTIGGPLQLGYSDIAIEHLMTAVVPFSTLYVWFTTRPQTTATGTRSAIFKHTCYIRNICLLCCLRDKCMIHLISN